MKERIFTNWTITRILYLFMGGTIIIPSVMSRQWFGAALGVYFASMGLFAFGCASGSCFGGICEAEPKQKTSATVGDVEFEEVEAK